MIDQNIQKMIDKEYKRLSQTIGLIASENFPSQAVLDTLSSPFIGEYAEGYPGRRYYEGREVIDELEELVRERAKKLFAMDHANVQAYSGAIANLAIYSALLKPGDKIMGLRLDHGGHLSHGWKVTLSGKFYTPVQYELDPKTRELNFDAIRKLAKKEKPQLIIAGYSAYPRTIDFAAFREIANEVGAYLLADISHIAGLVVAGVHPSPAPYADVVMTTTHKTLRGPRGAIILCKNEYAEAIDKAVFPGLQGGPHEHTIGAIGQALAEADTPDFKKYATNVIENAKVLAKTLTENSIDLVSGGTENHLLLADLTKTGVTGTEAAKDLLHANIVLNRNTIPDDPRSPFDPSGIRIGTPGVTTRGMGSSEMQQIGEWIADIVFKKQKPEEIEKAVKDLAGQFPLPYKKPQPL